MSEAISGLNARVIYKEHSTDNVWVGTYTKTMKAISISSPYGDINEIDTSTLEDFIETHVPGRRTSSGLDIQGSYRKEDFARLGALEDKILDFILLLGNDGKGDAGKIAFTGKISTKIDDVSDDHVTMTSHITVSTVPAIVTDALTVTPNAAEEEFTVAAA